MRSRVLKKFIVAAMFFVSAITVNTIGANASVVNYLYGKGENLTDYKFERLSDNIHDDNYYKVKCIKPNGSYAKNEWIQYKYKFWDGDICDDWLYFGNDCVDIEGWFQVGGAWYFGDKEHTDDHIGILTDDLIDGRYYVNSSGQWVPK